MMNNSKKYETLKQFGGIVLLNKPSGPSSQSALTQLRRRFGLKKIGHGGTLDPLAQGLLVCAVDEATKFLSYSSLNYKIYKVIAQLGLTSDTEDRLSSNITIYENFEKIEHLSSHDVLNALNKFKGLQFQKPPKYSALKHKGQCRYTYARRGEIIPDPEPRAIVIDALENFSYDRASKIVTFEVQCSSGTYVRSLVRDLGEDLGCGAILMELTRIVAAPFHLENSYTLEQLLAMSYEEFFLNAVNPMELLCQNLPKIILPTAKIFDLCLGRDVYFELQKIYSSIANEAARYKAAIFDEDSGLFCGIGEIADDTKKIYPKRWISNFLERKMQIVTMP